MTRFYEKLSLEIAMNSPFENQAYWEEESPNIYGDMNTGTLNKLGNSQLPVFLFIYVI
jgi:hypothetical protein